MTLRLAPGLALPDDFATQGVAIIGVRGSGKSNTEVRYAELLHGAGIPFVAVDPKGDWYGVRMEGAGPGLPIPVFGGLYGDFPLDEHTGGRIADLLVDENLSAVLDVSRLSKTVALPRFLTEFCNRLMDRHQQEPHVRCVILEEAHRYIPQNVTGKTAALKEAAASLLLEGRSFGIGCWACTQRPARLHNDVLEEVDTAVIHRIGVTATADLRRVREWVKHEDLGTEVSESLTKLRTGEAWILSPVALGIVQRVQIDRRTTFDSGATPVTGAARREMATMATIDASAIKEALADAIVKADATDPKKLQARVRELERELSRVRADIPEPERIVETVEVPAPFVPPEFLELTRQLGILLTDLEEPVTALGELSEKIDDVVLQRADSAAAWTASHPPASAPDDTRHGSGPKPRAAGTTAPRGAQPPAPAREPSEPDGIVAGARRMLDALATYTGGLTKAQLRTLAKMKKSGTSDTYVGRLLRAGFVTEDNGTYRITDAGLEFVGGERPPADPEALRDSWRQRLGVRSGERRIFDVLCGAYPDGYDKAALAELTELESSSGTYGTYLGRLRRNGLIDDSGEIICAHPDLFMESA